MVSWLHGLYGKTEFHQEIEGMAEKRRRPNRRVSNADDSPPGARPAAPTVADKRSRADLRRSLLLGAAIGGAALLLAGAEAYRLLHNPAVFYLQEEPGAEWIRADDPFALVAPFSREDATIFETEFTTTRPVQAPRLILRAFRHADVVLDGRLIASAPADLHDWQRPLEVDVPRPVGAGKHHLVIRVINRNAHPCLWAASDMLGVHTGRHWFTVEQSGKRVPAAPVTRWRTPALALRYPTVPAAFRVVGPWLALLFAAVFGWTIWKGRRGARLQDLSPRRLTPGRVRGLLLLAWIVLAANNIWQVPSPVGYDVKAHLDYVEFIATHRTLPLATDGWQMFQPPLFYLLAAPAYAILSPHYGPDALVIFLRFLPLACGLAQIEIVYRTARAVFPGNDDLQSLATVVGGLMPMHIYISQVIGNEPLAGCLTAGVVLLCVRLLVDSTRARRRGFFIVLGFLWGLALLAKVTPFLLAPLLVAATLAACRAAQLGWLAAAGRLGLLFGAASVASGWFFVRNWLRFGQLVIAPGHWGPALANTWWQDPSFRTWEQLASFGTALNRPLYGCVWSIWDALYSSLWLDGSMSGVTIPPEMFPWNLNWMLVGAWLGLVPTVLLCTGAAACWRTQLIAARRALVFAAAAVAIYLAAIVDLFVQLPIYTTAKATYTLGMLPCYAVLAAAGAAPLIKYRTLRAAIVAALACWAVSAYAAYFSVDYLNGRGMFAP